MADITISDLELAPALADDMVFPVENTTDTYAATLAMLRRLLNKTFVEVEDADFNDLTDDGFYQCTGTPTNSPEAGEINWTLQVSAESGVVVQRAFSLDDNFANLYIRRWNGVTWTAWIEEGGGALTHKADIDASNFTAEGKETIVGWGMPDYSLGQDVTSSCYASSGTGFAPPKNGLLQIMGTNVNGGQCLLYIYNKSGTLVVSSIINSESSSSGSGSLVTIPVNKNFTYRVNPYAGYQTIKYFPLVGA